jgi:hypothetical protein
MTTSKKKKNGQMFNPFARSKDPLQLTKEDVKLLSRPSKPLKILVPVVIEEDE